MIDIAGLLAATDLVALIGHTVKLTKRGREWVGLCPFHSEKSPSFCVMPAKGFYYCHGCGAHGDAIAWVRRVEGLDLKDACARLGGKGLTMEQRRALATAEKRRQRENTERRRRAAALDAYRDGHPQCDLPDWAIEV